MELLQRLDAPGEADQGGVDGEAFTLIDTRQAESFDGWHLPGAENIPFDPTEGFTARHRSAVAEVADGDQVVVVCGKGLTSTPFGIHLDDVGFDDVTVVQGGMEAVSTVHENVEITDQTDIYIEQFQRRATGCLSYLIGDPTTGEAVVVDPTRQVDTLLAAAESAGFTITTVIDTHVHVDHLSGGAALASARDTPYFVGIDISSPTVTHPYAALQDGETLTVGTIPLTTMHTPGHTEAMATLVVGDEYVVTADTLHLDSVGRTELAFGEDDGTTGADLLYDSIHTQLFSLDDTRTVLPGHVSLTDDLQYETKSTGEPICDTLGDIRTRLELLDQDRESFITAMTSDLPEKPDDYEQVIAINAGKATVETEEDAAELETGPNSCAA